MRVKLLFCFLLFITVPPFAPAQENESLTKSVNAVIFGHMVQGWDIKTIARAGDAAAVSVTKLVGSRTLENQQIESVLYVLKAAFSQPSSIESPENKEPNTALFILHYLDATTQDASLKAKVTEASQSLQSLLVRKP
jgi:hypothetical protein